MKEYKIGYCPGGFDLFHMGHLKLLMRSKERCEILIAGVVSDELYTAYKMKPPIICFEERIAIVQAIRYVDKAICVTPDIMDKYEAWKVLRYNCHFSGTDYVDKFEREKAQLGAVGAKMEFFDYTKSISSTKIRNSISNA